MKGIASLNSAKGFIPPWKGGYTFNVSEKSCAGNGEVSCMVHGLIDSILDIFLGPTPPQLCESAYVFLMWRLAFVLVTSLFGLSKRYLMSSPRNSDTAWTNIFTH